MTADEKPKLEPEDKADFKLKELPVKITSIILVVCGLLCFFFGIGFVIVRVKFQAYPLVIGYHIWCGLIIAAAGGVGIASYKKAVRKLAIAAGVMGIITELTSMTLCQFTIRLLFEKVGRTAAWMAEPEAEAAAKAEGSAEPESTAKAEPEISSAEPEMIYAHQMDIFLQISAFLAVVYLVSGVCGGVMAGYTMAAACSKNKCSPEKEKEKETA